MSGATTDVELLRKTLAAHEAAYGSHPFFVATSKAERLCRRADESIRPRQLLLLQKAVSSLMKEVAIGRTVRLCSVLLGLVAGLFSHFNTLVDIPKAVPAAVSSTEKVKRPFESSFTAEIKRPQISAPSPAPQKKKHPPPHKNKNKNKKMKTALSALGTL
eukprot:TRINITY_DN14708_c0_g1_i1.p1 TRINITY_DN14708_c0_g1~~TRINITY_DN14708_c0_g1_i1.p1  ORF type:complete len:160 (+),score=24.67 TRINITY_DN14708_c0_g1_i1:61-540(+)